MEFNIKLTIDDSVAENAIDILAANFRYGLPDLKTKKIKGEGMTKEEFVMQEEEAYLKKLIMGTIKNSIEREAIKTAKASTSALGEAITFNIEGNT